MNKFVKYFLNNLKQRVMSYLPEESVSALSSDVDKLAMKRKKEKEKWRAKKKLRKEAEEDSDNEDMSRKDQGLPFKKAKFAVLLMYSGKGYSGLQINPMVQTIEADIYKALVASGLVTQRAVDTNAMRFQRCARTDKGVSAAGQVLSVKMFKDVDNPVEKLNANLPDAIRILDAFRATKSFDSKNHCDGRTYSYLCPTYAFTQIEDIVVKRNFRITEEITVRINELLSKFVGTHNFHNYTSGKLFKDPSAKRYILSFRTAEKYVFDEVEYIVLRVRGQSFLLHQIRKMIGIVITIIRGHASESFLDKSWLSEKADVPIAPGLGLMLEQPHFDIYNKNYGKDRHVIDFNLYKDTIEEFKKNVIYKEIVTTEENENSMFEWLKSLHVHCFDNDGGPDKSQRRPTSDVGLAMKLLNADQSEVKETDESRTQTEKPDKISKDNSEETEDITQITEPQEKDKT